MIREVLIRPAAARDLNDLYVYIRDRSGPVTAIGYVRRIRTFCEGLGVFSERGRKRDDIRAGLRLAAFERNVVIAFLVTDETVRIGRIFYKGRDVDVLLGESPHAYD